MKQILCPISNERVNEWVTRINALLGIVLIVIGFVFSSISFIVFLLVDFFIRAFTKAKYSPISYVSLLIANTLNLEKRNTDKAPKIFAARIGFLMTLAITILLLLNQNIAALVVGGILVFFALLEFGLTICVGCIMYTYLILPFYKK